MSIGVKLAKQTHVAKVGCGFRHGALASRPSIVGGRRIRAQVLTNQDVWERCRALT